MRRRIYTNLLKWKENSCGASALLIQGARRVGKSYIAEEFAALYDDIVVIMKYPTP